MHQPKHFEHRKLINGIATLLSDNVICAKTWGFYLFAPEFNEELELRNKCGVIWLMALLDSVDGETQALAKYEAEAAAARLDTAQTVCVLIRNFVHQVSALLVRYSREEQLFLSSLRDQWVHGWLAKKHRPQFSAKYFDGTKVVSEPFTYDAYHATLRPFYEDQDGLDPVLTRLLSRAVDNNLPYWQSIHALKDRVDEMVSAMLNDREFKVAQLEA